MVIGVLTLLLMMIMIFCGISVLLVEETEVFSENNQPVTRNVQMLSHSYVMVSVAIFEWLVRLFLSCLFSLFVYCPFLFIPSVLPVTRNVQMLSHSVF
jgi:hypothetical protein